MVFNAKLVCYFLLKQQLQMQIITVCLTCASYLHLPFIVFTGK